MFKYFKSKKIFLRQVRVSSASSPRESGFSLVEMLVAIAIFMSIMTVAISSLISIINATKKAQAIKSTIDSVTFALESVSRDMRIGSDYKCVLANGDVSTNCSIVDGSTAVEYMNPSNHRIVYTFNGDANSAKGVLTRTDLDCGTSQCVPVDLISQDAKVNITDMTFYIIGADCEDGIGQNCTSGRTQPRVVITASGLISSTGNTATTFNLQTNISQIVRR